MKRRIFLVSLMMLIALFVMSGCVEEEVVSVPIVNEDLEEQGTCIDGIKNGNEEDVDCGGIHCSACVEEAIIEEVIIEEPEEEIPKIITYELTQTQEDNMLGKLKKSTKSDFLVNSYPTGLEVGESYIFVHGITHTDIDAGEPSFRYIIEFKDARDSMNNPISVDEDSILEWFSNNKFPAPELKLYDQYTTPVGITVGEEIASGIATKPGTYYFNIIVEMDKGYKFDKYSTNDFSFRVKE